jgi:hypothetical protein
LHVINVAYYVAHVNYKVDKGREACHPCHMDTERKPFPVRLNELDLSKIDDLRRLEADIPTRPEMMRRLIERAWKDRGRKK